MPAEKKTFASPDETREIGNGVVKAVTVQGSSVGSMTMQPGWKWSNDVKPIVGTDSCQGDHLGYAVSGTLHVVTEDGTELDVTAGDVYAIKPGHDAWVVGDQPFEGMEFTSKTVETYAKD